MTIAVFDLTEHTQISVRGTTGTHPDSDLVFGVFMDADAIMPDSDYAYDDVDWSRAVQMAKWILAMDEALHPKEGE